MVSKKQSTFPQKYPKQQELEETQCGNSEVKHFPPNKDFSFQTFPLIKKNMGSSLFTHIKTKSVVPLL